MRIDGGRKVFASYYAFTEWPLWILHKSDAWLCFGALRTSIIYDVKGGVSAVFALVMRMLFVSGPVNSTTGFVISCNDSAKLIRASLRGIIADEKGLKEAFDIKGASGKKFCISCQNMFNFIHKGRHRASDYQIPANSTDTRAWIPHTDESIRELHTRLGDIKATGERGWNTKFKTLETEGGVNYNPRGLLGDSALRRIVKPVSHYIRDWQHTYCSNGIASGHLSGVLHAIIGDEILEHEQITLETITEYCSHYTLPSCYGKVSKH